MSLLGIIPRGAVRILPGTSRHFGPPRRWATFSQYRQRYRCVWREVLPATSCLYPKPEAAPALSDRLWRAGWPEQGVAFLPGARALGAEGWPVGEDDTLLIDLATGLERPEYTAYLTGRCRIDRSRGGRALNLASCYARENYCHFLLDALPRLELALRAGISLDAVDWVLVPDFLGASREAFFRALGLPERKLLRLPPGVQYRFDELIQPSFPGRESFVPPWVAEFYRRRLLEPLGWPTEPRVRLYVARSQRGLANDDEVWRALEPRGFLRVEPGTWEENVGLFSRAEMIVGPHGAGLSNVIFSPPDCRLIEIVPGDRPFPYFYSAACAAGVGYTAVLATPLAPAGQEYRRLPSDEPYRVDAGALSRAVEHALERVVSRR